MKVKSRIVVTFACAGLFFGGNTTGAADPDDLQAIQAAIKAKGAQWTAGESWVTSLSPDERRLLLMIGQQRLAFAPTMSATPSAAIPAQFGYPPAIDWRNRDGWDWVTPVKNQGVLGSCLCFAEVAVMESMIRIGEYCPKLPIDLSEMHLYNCAQSDPWNYLISDGIPDEACWPYAPEERSCSETCPDWRTRAFKISTFVNISQVDEMKSALTRAPIVAAPDLLSDFFYYKTGIYEPVSGYNIGHAVCIVGYDTTGPVPYWIVKNSWGTGWGENGFCRIKMSGAMSTYMARLPDFTLTSSDILANPGQPKNGDLVTLSAHIQNIGMPSGQDAIVQFFDGDPVLSGNLIGEDDILQPHTASKSDLWGYEYQTGDISKLVFLNHCDNWAGGLYLYCKLREIRIDIKYDVPFINNPCLEVWSTGYSAQNPHEGCSTWVDIIDQRPDGCVLRTFALYIGYTISGSSVKKWLPGENATFGYRAAGLVKGDTAQVTWDTRGKSGPHNIYVSVNPDTAVWELDTQNNTACKSLVVSGFPGDLNADGKVDQTDYLWFRATLGKCEGQAGYNSAADYDGDKCVTYSDYRLWYQYYKTYGTR